MLLVYLAAIHFHVTALRGAHVRRGGVDEASIGASAPRPESSGGLNAITAAAGAPFASPSTKSATDVADTTADTAAAGLHAPCLAFVHITKTGGTAIEKLAARHGVAWGACAWITNSAPFDTVCSGIKEKYNHWRHDRGELTPWHNPNVVPQQYTCPKLFAVVRNPYTRLVSEFFSPWGGWPGEHSASINVDAMNGWITYHITHLESNSGNGQWDWAFHGARQVRENELHGPTRTDAAWLRATCVCALVCSSKAFPWDWIAFDRAARVL